MVVIWSHYNVTSLRCGDILGVVYSYVTFYVIVTQM